MFSLRWAGSSWSGCAGVRRPGQLAMASPLFWAAMATLEAGRTRWRIGWLGIGFWISFTHWRRRRWWRSRQLWRQFDRDGANRRRCDMAVPPSPNPASGRRWSAHRDGCVATVFAVFELVPLRDSGAAFAGIALAWLQGVRGRLRGRTRRLSRAARHGVVRAKWASAACWLPGTVAAALDGRVAGRTGGEIEWPVLLCC